MKITIRRATEADKNFLITAITEAEKSGGETISYCAIFGISENALKDMLGNILDEDMEGQELCTTNFLIAEVDGEKAAALSTWIENEHGMASNIIKSNMLMYFLDADIIAQATPALKLMNEVNITREEKALQVECVYTAEKFRGMGLTRQLINEHIRLKQAAGTPINKAQIILLKNNTSAINAYQKAGFAIAQERRCSDEAILKLLPCDTKIIMERTF